MSWFRPSPELSGAVDTLRKTSQQWEDVAAGTLPTDAGLRPCGEHRTDLPRCSCRKGAIWPACPRHGIGIGRYRANLGGMVLLVLVVMFSLFTAPSDAAGKPPGMVICEVFGDRHCGPAIRVAWCESRLQTTARNGQYRGIFQMGSWERRKYGHGPTVRAQSVAAHRYFVATGKDWSPWECKP